jgi:hypothetical protein
MTDINLKTLTPDTSLPTTGYLFGADSQSVSTPSVYSTQTVATTLLGSTSLTGDTLTASAPVLNLAQTWNNGSTTFTGIKFNVTSDTSAAASLLMDLQVASTSKFSVKKDGSVSTGAWQGTAVGVAYGGTGQTTASAGFNALSPVTSTGDLIVGNGTNSSTRLGIGSTGQVLTVSGGTATWAAAASGSGTVTSVSVTTANGVSGTVATATTTPAITLTLGAITPTSVALNSDAFLTRDAANIVAQRNTTNAQTFRAYNTYTDASNYERGVFDWTTTANTLTIGTEKAGTGSTRNLQFVVGGTVVATFDSVGTLTLNKSNVSGGLNLANYGRIDSFSWSMSNTNGYIGLGANTDLNGDVRLYRDAANTLAQRNGTAAQTLNIYNTYTSSTSFERYSIDWITTANLAIVGPNKGSGGGTQRVQRLSYLEDGGAGSTVPVLGTTCPAASATVKSWIKIITSDGTTAYIPCWA